MPHSIPHPLGEDEPKPTPPPRSQPEPDVPEPDDEIRELVYPVKT